MELTFSDLVGPLASVPRALNSLTSCSLIFILINIYFPTESIPLESVTGLLGKSGKGGCFTGVAAGWEEGDKSGGPCFSDPAESRTLLS